MDGHLVLGRSKPRTRRVLLGRRRPLAAGLLAPPPTLLREEEGVEGREELVSVGHEDQFPEHGPEHDSLGTPLRSRMEGVPRVQEVHAARESMRGLLGAFLFGRRRRTFFRHFFLWDDFLFDLSSFAFQEFDFLLEFLVFFLEFFLLRDPPLLLGLVFDEFEVGHAGALGAHFERSLLGDCLLWRFGEGEFLLSLFSALLFPLLLLFGGELGAIGVGYELGDGLAAHGALTGESEALVAGSNENWILNLDGFFAMETLGF